MNCTGIGTRSRKGTEAGTLLDEIVSRRFGALLPLDSENAAESRFITALGGATCLYASTRIILARKAGFLAQVKSNVIPLTLQRERCTAKVSMPIGAFS
jgi:hypothetical protein